MKSSKPFVFLIASVELGFPGQLLEKDGGSAAGVNRARLVQRSFPSSFRLT